MSSLEVQELHKILKILRNFGFFLRFIAVLHGLLRDKLAGNYSSPSFFKEVYFTRHSIIAIRTTAIENQRKLLEVEKPAKKS